MRLRRGPTAAGSSLRTALGVVGRTIRASPLGLHDRVNIWTTIGFSLLVGDRRPCYYILGYPSSGTNWVCNMLAGYLGIPVYEFWKSRLPHFSPAVIHMHRFLPVEGARRRTLYVMRDGRDVVISEYYHRMRDRSADASLSAELDYYLGAGYDPEAISANLPGFIRYLIERSAYSTDYVSHVERALSHRYARVRYEDLIVDAHTALGDALARLLNESVDPKRLADAIDAQRFEKVTGRKPGSEDAAEFVRKGVSGDWLNMLTREAAEIYDAYAGDTLIRCGYESDHSWVGRCSG